MNRAALVVFIRDTVGLAAVCLISAGAYMVYPPAGYIVAGSLVLAGVMLASRVGPRE